MSRSTKRAPWFAAAALAAAALLPSAVAQPALLPAETVFAVGVTGLTDNASRFQPFVDEFERLELGDLLGRLFADEMDDEMGSAQLPAGLEGLELLDIVGNEAWLSVSVSPFNPLPAVSLILHPSGEALAAMNDRLPSIESEPGTQVLTEGSYTFYFVPTDDMDDSGLLQGFAVALAGGNVIVSTNPDVLRGTLRLLAGSTEPSFAQNEHFLATQAATGPGNLYTFTDFAQIGQTAETFLAPLAAQAGFESLVTQLVSALNTAGVMANSVTITDSGTSSSGVQIADAAGGDAALYALLTDATAVSRSGLAFVPADALAVSGTHTNPSGWWDYLNGIVRNSPELGLSSLDELVSMLLGVDLRSSFFDWIGNDWTSASLGFPAALEPGMPSENLLGETLFVIDVSSETAAQRGLDELLGVIGATVSSFTDPFGAGAGEGVLSTDTEVDGVVVRTTTLADGLTISYAVTGGNLLFATDATSVSAAVSAHASSNTLGGQLASLIDSVPADATSYSVANDRAVMENTAAGIGVQLQTLGALGMGSVDFDDLEQLSGKAEQFLQFVAGRLGGSVSYSTVQGNKITKAGSSEISW
jgi:hypothetical protein